MPRFALPGAVLLALAIAFVIAWGTQPGTGQVTAQGGQQAAVASITRSCPPAVSGSTTRISMIALPATGSEAVGTGTANAPAATPAGTATFSAVLAASPATTGAKTSPTGKATGKPSASGAAKTTGARPVTVSAPGTAASVTSPGNGGTAVAATGKMAEGFEAEQTDASGTGLVSCTHPGSDMWFVGTGETTGAPQIRLYLMNTGNLTATAVVTILTDTGQQNGLNSAITVAPDQSVSEDITPYAGGSQAIALHVQANSGQIAAAVWEGNGTSGAWLPQAASPATTLVIPGLTVASSPAKLFVVVPGATAAGLKVVAYTPAGAVNQFPGSPVDASAGATTPFALNSLGASAAGLKLNSNVPIVAGVLVSGTGIGSFTAAVPPITEQGVVAGNPSSRGATVGLLLTAPSATARASISVIGADGTVMTPAGDQSVTVAAGRTLAVAVPRPQGTRQPFAIVVTPQASSGPLYAARVVTSGTGGLSAPLSSLLPVSSAMTSITLPPAQNSYTAVLPLSQRLVEAAAVAGVYRVRVQAEDAGELLDHDVEDQLGEFAVGLRPGHQRAAVDHDARGCGRASRIARVRRSRDRPGERQWHAVVNEFVGLGNLLHGELHARQFGLPARLETCHRVEHHVVELLGPSPVEGDARRHEATAKPAPVPVPPPNPRQVPSLVLATLHKNRAYPAEAPPDSRAPHGRPTGRTRLQLGGLAVEHDVEGSVFYGKIGTDETTRSRTMPG